MIKALARSRGLTVSGYLEKLIAAEGGLKVGEEDWMECSIRGRGSRPRTCRSTCLRYI
jgi:hypothetical protein